LLFAQGTPAIDQAPKNNGDTGVATSEKEVASKVGNINHLPVAVC
jgi:hypothetical protein